MGTCRIGAVAAVVLLACSCSHQSAGTAAGKSSSLSVDAIYAQAQRSLKAAGVYHQTIDTVTTQGDEKSHTTVERWIDVSHDVSRTLRSYSVGGQPAQQATELVSGGVEWLFGQQQSAKGCHGARAVAALALGCPGPTEDSKTTAEQGSYQGQPALVLATSGTVQAEDSASTTTSRTNLDPVTALPLGATSDGTVKSATVVPLHEVTTYRGEDLAPGSLKADFFDPASLGRHAPDPEDALGHGLPFYWLGRTWSPGGKLPAVTLQQVEGPGGPGYAAILDYAPVSDRFGPRVLMIQVWTAAAWARAHVGMGVRLCTGTSHLTLPGGEATLYRSDPPDGISAMVTLGQTHLLIAATGASGPSGSTTSPYNSVAAMQEVLEHLSVHS